MKEFWAKNKIWLILVLIIIVLVISVIVSESTKKESDNALVKEASERFNGDGVNIIYLMSATCSWCEQFSPIVEEVANEYNLDIYKIDMANFTTDADYNAFLDVHSYLSNTWTGGTPTVVVLEDGNVVDENGGYVEKDEFINFLKEAKVIE